MEIRSTIEFEAKLGKLCQRNKRLREKIDNKLRTFLHFPKHPSLRLHKLKSRKVDDWSVCVDRKIRIIFNYRAYGILLVDIGSHDQVY